MYTRIMERNYDYLKGTEVKLIWNDGSIKEAFVSGCDPKRGISIVDIDNPDYEYICLNYEDYKEDKEKYPNDRRNYLGTFMYLVRAIEKGSFDVSIPDKIYRRDQSYDCFTGYASHMKCSFK